MTIGNTSNDAYITFYNSNLLSKAYNIGLCNDTFVFMDLFGTTRVGINTHTARSTLDVNGTVGMSGMYSYGVSNVINVNQSTLSNIKDVYYTGVVYNNGVPITSRWFAGSNETVYTMANVGIGTTYPGYGLDVSGDVNFTGALTRGGVTFRESPFRYLAPSLSNLYYGGSVGMGVTGSASNELVSYRMFVHGDVAIDGKLYANDFIIYKGENPGKYKEVDIYGISPYSENKVIVTNSLDSACNVLYEFRLKASQYMTFVNLPYKNLSGTAEVGGKNWFEVVLVAGSASNYHYSSNFISKVPIEVRSSESNVDIDNVEFFIESSSEQDYVLAVRGFGHTLEFGGVSFDQYNSPYVQYNSRLRIIPIKNIGDDSSFSVKKALQITPIRQQYILTSNTTTFNFSTEGRYEAYASNVDVFINGLKYVYYSNTKKDYDVSYSYNYDTKITTFTLQLAEPAQVDDVLDIAIWPYATSDSLYASGYYYQQINQFPTQWLNVMNGMGVRYPKSVVVDGDLIVRGSIVGGCNTDIFFAGLPTGDLAFTCNVVGTTNIIDGAITHSKLAYNAVRNYNIPDYLITPQKLDFKDRVVAIGCNINEITINPTELPRNRGLYVDGDVFIKGSVQACNFAGSTESIADLSVTTIKLAPQAVTYDKLGVYAVSNLSIANNAISTRHLQTGVVATSNLALGSVTADRIAFNTIARSNLAARIVTSNEIDNYSITVNQLNLVSGNVGVGTLLGQSKLHVVGDSLLVGHVRSGGNGVSDIGGVGEAYRRVYVSDFVSVGDYQMRRTADRFEVLQGNGSVANWHSGNIGIGTTVSLERLDIFSGGVLVRAGQVGIGTTIARSTIDALGTAGSTLLINKVGIATGSVGSGLNCAVYGGSVYMEGNVGIGSVAPVVKLDVNGGSMQVVNSGGVAYRGVGSNLLLGTSITHSLEPDSSGRDIGLSNLPYHKVYAQELFLGSSRVSYSNSGVVVSVPVVVNGGLDYSNFYPYRNWIINGGMQVNQRYPGSNNYIYHEKARADSYTLDRHYSYASNASTVLVVSQSNVFQDYVLACRVGVSTSSLNSDTAHLIVGHRVENVLCEKMAWGTALAQPVSVSFDLLSPVNATYYLALHNWNRSRSLVRDVVGVGNGQLVHYSYVIPGDTGGDWSGSIGLEVGLYSGVGSGYVTGSENVWLDGTYLGRGSSTTFVSGSDGVACVTNLQVELGSLPTTFERRPLLTELPLCQRYYEKSYNFATLPGSGTAKGGVLLYCATSEAGSANWVTANVNFKVPKRNDSWNGQYYSIGGSVNKISYREATTGNFVDYTEALTPSASNTVFGIPSENGYATNFQANAQASRTYAYQWVVENEM